MAKYYGSPWGTIIGTLGDTVGMRIRGVNCIRERVIPRNPRTVKQTNRRRVFGMLTYIAKTNLRTLVHPVFEKECKRKRLKLTGSNLFIRVNATRLYDSIPDKDKIWGVESKMCQEVTPDTTINVPDYTKMLISIGRLEPCCQIISTSYNKSTGEISIRWHTGIYQNGKEEDKVYIGVFEEPQIKLPYGRLTVYNTEAKRGDGSCRVETMGRTHRLAPTLFVYIFFRNKDIGYSGSRGKRVKS